MATRQMNVTLEAIVLRVSIDPTSNVVNVSGIVRVQGTSDVGRAFDRQFTVADLTAGQLQAAQTLVTAAQGWLDAQLAGL